MKYNFLITIIVICGLMIYGKDIIKSEFSSSGKLNKHLEFIRELKTLAGNSGETEGDMNNYFKESPEWQQNALEMNMINEDDLNEYGEIRVELMSPVMTKIMNTFSRAEAFDIENFSGSIYLWYLNFSQINMKLGAYYILFGGLIIVFSLYFNKYNIYHLALIIGKAGFFFGGFFLKIISMAAVIFWLLIQQNIWSDAGVNIFLGPVGILAGSAMALKVYDPNFPVYNRFLRSMLMPVLSATVMNAGIMFF